MPVFQYVVLNGKEPQELIEIEQEVSDPPFKEHPITKEPIRKVISSPTLSLRHSDANEKRTLSEANLKKNGFSLYQKDQEDGSYHKKTGNGPESLHP
jgi:predicted nucleic acid-binding Zn ribbon protein